VSIKAFGDMLLGQGNSCATIGKALASRLNVPYHEDRVGGSKLLGYRHSKRSNSGYSRGPGAKEEDLEGSLLPTHEFKFPNGEILRTTEWPKRIFEENAVQLTEEVWEQDPYWPDSFNDVLGAVQKLQHGITGVYHHGPSMNLVLLGPSGEKVGIRSTALSTPFIGLHREQCQHLGKLKKAWTV